MTPKAPGLLVRYLQQKRCVVFVGAGMSVGAGLPTWSKLLLNGIQELAGALPDSESHQQELEALVQRGKLLEVADFCKEKLGAAYHQFLTEQVRGDQSTLPSTHAVLMQLPFSAWVTTNYDKLLERAYSKEKGGFPKTLTHQDTESLGRLLFDGGEFILKAHGDIDRPETVVLTSRDYSDIIHANPAFNEVFSGLLLTKALLFVGYSLSDPDFRLLLDRQLTHFKGFVPERYALMTGVGPVEREVLWRTARIQVISYENVSGDHAEVLEFLQSLRAAMAPAPAPAPQAGGVKMSVPPQTRAHNVAAPPHLSLESLVPVAPAHVPVPPVRSPGSSPAPAAVGAPSRHAEDLMAFSLHAELGQDAEEAPAPPEERPGPELARSEPYELKLERFVKGRVRFWLSRGKEPVADGFSAARLNEAVVEALHKAVADSQAEEAPASLYSELTQLFRKHLPPEFLEALEASGVSHAPLVVRVPARLCRFPWELLPVHGQPLCLERRLVRAPVGISAQARGIPRLGSPARILIIEGVAPAAGGASEVERLAKQYEGTQRFSCKVLRGADATFARVMAELDAGLPDLLHYTGKLGRAGGELFLELPGDEELSEGALRSVLSQGRLPFLVLNAPSSAFAPPAFGLYPGEARTERVPGPKSSEAAFEGHEGFMELASQVGVGAFIGAFDNPSAEAGSAFMASLHHALLTGLPVIDAVRGARKKVHEQFPGDPTALQYVLSGEGALQLWDSSREDARE